MADTTASSTTGATTNGTNGAATTTATKGATGTVAPAAAAADAQVTDAPQATVAAVTGKIYVEAPTTTVSETDTDAVRAAVDAAREENEAREANPNKVVFRKTEDGSFFDVGHAASPEEDPKG